MVKNVKKLTVENAEDAVIDIGQDAAQPDLEGKHIARIEYCERKTYGDDKHLYIVGARIRSGDGQGEMVFGRVFPQRSLRALLQAAHAKVGNDGVLHGKDLIGTDVQIDVSIEKDESGNERYTITGFRQTPSDEPATGITA